MNCDEFQNRIKEQRLMNTEFEKHIANCDSCAQLWKINSLINDFVAFERQVVIPESKAMLIMEDIKKSGYNKFLPIAYRTAMRYAAIVLMVFGGYIGGVFLERFQSSIDTQLLIHDYYFFNESGFQIETGWINAMAYEE